MTRIPNTFADNADAALFAEELSDKLAEISTELSEGNNQQATQLMMEVDAGMEDLEEYLGIESFDHDEEKVVMK